MPLVGPKKGPKILPAGVPKEESKIGENIVDYGTNEGEVHKPLNGVRTLTGQQNHRDLAEAQMEGGFAFRGSAYSHNEPSSSNDVGTGSKVPKYAPPQSVRVVRFPKEKLVPDLVWKQTVDVKADQFWGDDKLSNIPDFREDWGDGDEWHQHRRAYSVFVAPIDIPEVKLHGRYVVFSTYDPGYEKNKHKMLQSLGRHTHEDVFVAKIGPCPNSNRWTNYTDVPDEFLSAETKDGWKVYQIMLIESNNSMLGALQA